MAAWLAGLAGLWFGARQGLKGSPKSTLFASLVILVTLFVMSEIWTARGLKSVLQLQRGGSLPDAYVPVMIISLVGLGVGCAFLVTALAGAWRAHVRKAPLPWRRLRYLILGAAAAILMIPVCAVTAALYQEQTGLAISMSVPNLLLYGCPALLLLRYVIVQERRAKTMTEDTASENSVADKSGIPLE